MKHTVAFEALAGNENEALLNQALGKFYTPTTIAARLIAQVIQEINFTDYNEFHVIDPFCGDGRLLSEFLLQVSQMSDVHRILWHVTFWDYDELAVAKSYEHLCTLAAQLHLTVVLKPLVHDTFMNADKEYERYDCVITNPPWETLKPDSRYLQHLPKDANEEYLLLLRDYDKQLAQKLPNSQPSQKYAGWGTNLSRCGLEIALRLTKPEGHCAIVVPLSVLTDQTSTLLRSWLFNTAQIRNLTYYPAESRLFERVDQEVVTCTMVKIPSTSLNAMLTRLNKKNDVIAQETLDISLSLLASIGYSVPVSSGTFGWELLERWQTLPTINDLVGKSSTALWIGRELDETRHEEFLVEHGTYRFLKGRMVGRYTLIEEPNLYVNEELRRIPISAQFYRVTWRDIARRNQQRRMHAAIIPPQIVTGNSLHVAYFKDNDLVRLRSLLAIMNSLPFEYQVRTKLGTAHISAGIVRQIHIPDIYGQQFQSQVMKLLQEFEAGNTDVESSLEITIAQAYGLNHQEFARLLEYFEKMPESMKSELLNHPLWLENFCGKKTQSSFAEPFDTEVNSEQAVGIPNHRTAKLSKLDLEIATAVPPGGNWKNVPDAVPSQRIKQIRESYTKGGGSRSTYYGRLHPDRPSYTINTHFARPGNGCHLHYDFDGGQHRVISQREAARLQSFPDTFVFDGTQRSINTQIGNAVPPLLAFQIARSLPFKGQYVDLFSGAGGLSLGFKWAGWEPIVANDLDSVFLQTYSRNIHNRIIAGSISENAVFDEVIKIVERERDRRQPLFVIGGPPCQGFSTAGNKRTMDDERNHLFYRFKAVVEALKPAGFVFENVIGLQNMEGGKVLELIQAEMGTTVNELVTWRLHSEEYGVPQRRARLIMVGHTFTNIKLYPPTPITYFGSQNSLFSDLAPAVSVYQALNDLPPLSMGEDGSVKQYLHEPKNAYQAFMRAYITADQYLESLRNSKSL